MTASEFPEGVSKRKNFCFVLFSHNFDFLGLRPDMEQIDGVLGLSAVFLQL